MSAPLRGRLLDQSLTPPSGELVEQVVRVGGALIEQILSGEVDTPVDFDQDHDEWVVLLHGAAELEVSGEPVLLEALEWVFIPRHTPHRLLRTTRGTRWLAVHQSRD